MIETTQQRPISIEVANLRSALERGDAITVLDVRTAADRAEWWIPGSLHVDAHDALWAGETALLDHAALPLGRPVVTVCGAGRTSLLAALRLRARGLEASSLSGGMRAWSVAWNVAEVPLAENMARVLQLRRTGKGCLSYLIGSEGEAAVIDPSLDPAVYEQLATEQGWKIRRVLDTHVHADHLSRARSLAKRCDAILHLPEQQRVAFDHAALREGDRVRVGGSTLTTLCTPGHTFESVCYLLEAQALFTGDTLFVDSVGRPDLKAGSSQELRTRAHALFHSLERLGKLPGETWVLPCHTGRPIAFDRQPITATLTAVRQRIELLKAPEEAFVEAILQRFPANPPNHTLIVQLNEAGLMPGGDPADLEAGANRCAIS